MNSILDLNYWNNIKYKNKIYLVYIYSKITENEQYNIFMRNIKENLDKGVKLYKVDIQNQELVDALDITSYPCIWLFNNGIKKNEYYLNSENLLLNDISFLT
jgi:hypothetical protein